MFPPRIKFKLCLCCSSASMECYHHTSQDSIFQLHRSRNDLWQASICRTISMEFSSWLYLSFGTFRTTLKIVLFSEYWYVFLYTLFATFFLHTLFKHFKPTIFGMQCIHDIPPYWPYVYQPLQTFDKPCMSTWV